MSQIYFEIDKFSHHFTLSKVTPHGMSVIGEFSKAYQQWGMVREHRRVFRKVVKVFATRSNDHRQYRFHIEQFPEFEKLLHNRQVHESCYTITEHIPTPGLYAHMPVREGWTPKPHQPPIIEYLIAPTPQKRKLVEIQTGEGKTFASMAAIAVIAQRLLIIIKPMYMDKWVEDVQKICEIAPDEVMMVSGSAQLMQLIALAKQGQLLAKVIIISNKTMQNWITLYEKIGDVDLEMLGYDCRPQDLMPLLNVGVRLIDEVHQDFHLNFKLDLYAHVERSISLSATLVADDPFLTKMYELAYPKAMRFAGLPYNKYIHSYSWIYRFNKPQFIKTNEFGQTSYSHIAFEKSLMKRPVELTGYIEMIETCVRQTYLQDYKPGDKLLIYCASINLCTEVKNRLKALHKNLDVRRYVEDDPYTNLLEPDIRVSTLLSAGTGHDIPGLTTVILTPSVSSTQSNIQGFGRLREIKGRRVNFIYFVCSDFQKQIDYHEKKKLILKNTALSYSSISYPHFIG
jgi:hypothetical protein